MDRKVVRERLAASAGRCRVALVAGVVAPWGSLVLGSHWNACLAGAHLGTAWAPLAQREGPLPIEQASFKPVPFE